MITFGIITNGKRPEKLEAEVSSIQRLNITDYEILIAGLLPPFSPLTEAAALIPAAFIPMDAAAEGGHLGAMRNALCKAAKGDILAITDDDIVYQADFYTGLQKYGDDFDILCTRLLNPDGTRNWDWVTKGGPRGHILLNYWENDPYLYCTGGRIVMKREIFAKVQWDEQKGFNQEEDVDFSKRAKAAGISIKMNKYSTLVHDDPSYTSAGHLVYKK